MELHKGDRVRVTNVTENGNTRITVIREGVCYEKYRGDWYTQDGSPLHSSTEGADVEVVERAPLVPNKPLTVTAPNGTVSIGFSAGHGVVVFYDDVYRSREAQKDYLEEMGYTVEYYTQG